MTARPCLDCGQLIARGSRCSPCQTKAKPPTPGRGSASVQARFRADTFATHGRRCALCGSTDRVQAHHVIPLPDGPNDGKTNGLPLCTRCHHGVEAGRRRRVHCEPSQ
ncbi:MAG: HNH endonuclease [Solirubrobacterales bacterium]